MQSDTVAPPGGLLLARHSSTYRPKDAFRARQRAATWSVRRYHRSIKTGVSVLAGVTTFGAVFAYKTKKDLDKRFRFFADMSILERGHDPYIHVKEQPDLKSKRRDHHTWFPWLQSRSHDPGTLLRLAQSEDRGVRHLGVEALADEHHWSDAEYRGLAQALDARTMVGLGRTMRADYRLFLPPPRLSPVPEMLEEQLRSLLSALPTDGLDKCTQYFISAALQKGSKGMTKEERGGLWVFGGNGMAFTESLSSAPSEVLELFCLQGLGRHSKEGIWTHPEGVWSFEGEDFLRVHSNEPSSLRLETFSLLALLGLSRVASHCPKIVEEGGLKVMRRIYDTRQGSLKIMRQIARILGNLALNKELHPDIIKTGWLTILAKWIQSRDIALSLHATKALANLDRDFGESSLYSDGVYLYYPQFRYRKPVYADIVFVHGLLGGPFRSWRQKDPPPRPSQRNVMSSPTGTTGGTADESKKTPKSHSPKIVGDAGETAVQAGRPADGNSDPCGGRTSAASSESRVGSSGVSPCKDDDRSDGERRDAHPAAVAEAAVEGSSRDLSTRVKDAVTQGAASLKRRLTEGSKGGADAPKDGAIQTNVRTADDEEEGYTYCWPKDWLARDCPNVRIVTVEYETHLSEWAPKCPYESDKRTVEVRSRELLDKLRKAGVGDRPIVWVGHSMGGLLIKKMLVMAQSDPSLNHIVRRSRGIVFYSVPHRGSPLAAYSSQTKFIYPSVEVKELQQDSAHLLNLHAQFKDLMFDTGMALLSFSEGQKTELPLNLKVMIVPLESSDPGFGELHVMDELNHLNVCKPTSKRAPLYMLTLEFIRDCLPFHRVDHALRAASQTEESILSEEDLDD